MEHVSLANLLSITVVLISLPLQIPQFYKTVAPPPRNMLYIRGHTTFPMQNKKQLSTRENSTTLVRKDITYDIQDPQNSHCI